jgi:hypothetical protein
MTPEYGKAMQRLMQVIATQSTTPDVDYAAIREAAQEVRAAMVGAGWNEAEIASHAYDMLQSVKKEGEVVRRDGLTAPVDALHIAGVVAEEWGFRSESVLGRRGKAN